ncbi:MAG: hypothetical protein ACRBCL_07785 [Maritimibacter sp.]
MSLDVPQGQRTALFQFIATTLILAIFAPRFLSGLNAGDFTGPDGLMAAARLMLIAVGVAIVLSIVVHILGTIVLAIATGTGEVQDLTDERDLAFSLRGERISSWVSGGALVFGLFLAWQGTSAPAVLGLALLGCAVGDLIANAYKLCRYVRG